MRSIIKSRNRHLLRDVEQLMQAIDQRDVLDELRPYVTQVQSLCEWIRKQILDNLRDMSLCHDAIIEDVLSNTQQATRYLRLLSSRMVTPILRSSPSDRLSLKFIGWLHQQHPSTANYPPVVTDGDCAIWPFLHICPVYFFPATEQTILLYLPLYFHEIGHLLYACHKQEIDALVQDLQQDVEDILTPPSSRSDKHASWQRSQREMIVTTWYKWAQEFFCDAVGLAIGGPAFLWAFSTYLGNLDRGDFYRTLPELSESAHPVTWLRMKMLVSRAAKLGLKAEAHTILDEWETIASTMGIVEDYHGFYDNELHDPLHHVLDDALIEVAPRPFVHDEINTTSGQVSPEDSPVALVHKAWRMFFSKSEKEYVTWEREAIASWLS